MTERSYIFITVSLFSVLGLTLAGFFYSSETSVKTTDIRFAGAIESLDLSSHAAPLCSTVFTGRSDFNYNLFKSRVAEWSQNPVSELDFSKLKPEEFLAFLEVSSKLGQFEGLDLESWLRTADRKKTKSILKISEQVISKAQKNTLSATKEIITERQLQKALVRLYKVTQDQKFSLLKSAQELNFKNALQNLREDYVAEYLHYKMIETNIVDAFSSLGFLRGPGRVDQFKNYMEQRKSAFWKAIAVITGVPAVMYGQLPPFLPSPDFVKKAVEKNPQMVDDAISYGYKSVLPKLTEDLKGPIQAQVASKFALRTFTLVSTLFLVGFVNQEVQLMRLKEAADRQQVVLEKIENISKMSEEAQDHKNLSTDELADSLLAKYIKEQATAGRIIESSSEEFKKFQILFREAHSEAIN